MRMIPALVLLLAACRGDETLTAYGGQGTWRLVELNGAPFTADATLTLDTAGEITGNGPCNSFSASQTAPYPWFETGPIRATRRACPDLAAETAFFTALGSMTLAEVAGDTLILSHPDGRTAVFRAD